MVWDPRACRGIVLLNKDSAVRGKELGGGIVPAGDVLDGSGLEALHGGIRGAEGFRIVQDGCVEGSRGDDGGYGYLFGDGWEIGRGDRRAGEGGKGKVEGD